MKFLEKLNSTDIELTALTIWMARKTFALNRVEFYEALGGMTRNQHLLGKINSGQVDPLAAHYISPIDEDSYTLLH